MASRVVVTVAGRIVADTGKALKLRISKACSPAYKVFFTCARGAYMSVQRKPVTVPGRYGRRHRIRFYTLPAGQQIARITK
jgi:hypothetical protein